MLLLSLGPDAVATLLCAGEGPRRDGPFAGPDLTWLLFGPDMKEADEAHDTAPVVTEMLRIRTSG